MPLDGAFLFLRVTSLETFPLYFFICLAACLNQTYGAKRACAITLGCLSHVSGTLQKFRFCYFAESLDGNTIAKHVADVLTGGRLSLQLKHLKATSARAHQRHSNLGECLKQFKIGDA